MDDDRALQFAERVIALVDSGKKSATYKLATLLALMDVAAEHTTPDGGPPSELSARDVGRRVVELYWPQSRAFPMPDGPPVLRQSAQNDIPRKLAAFRTTHGLRATAPLAEAASAAPEGWSRLERELIEVVIRMPLPKLQRFGDGSRAVEDRFLYDHAWPDEVPVSVIRRADFDDRLVLRPAVGAWLVRLTPLLRPLIESKWIDRVARQNPGLEWHRLDEFLFGATRVSLDRLRAPLLDVQRGRCFYCEGRLGGAADVDHFVPWSRHPDNLLDNLVVAHPACNNAKRASIASHRHLEAWVARSADVALEEVAAVWPRNRERSLGAVTSTYLWLPPETPLWLRKDEYERVDPALVRELLVRAVRTAAA